MVSDFAVSLPPKLRSALYVLLVIGSPIVGYLAIAQPEYVGPNEVAFWAAITTAIALIARFNVPSQAPAKEDDGDKGDPLT